MKLIKKSFKSCNKAAQPSKLTINGLSEFIDTYSDISKDDVRIAKNDTILFKNIDVKKNTQNQYF